MKYVKIEGNLRDVFGEKATKLKSEYGIKVSPEYQFIRPNEGINITLGTIIDETKAQQAIELNGVILLENEVAFNAEIDNYYKPLYKVTSDALYNANINKLITDGNLDLDEMLPEWTSEQELEYLYNKGVSGIAIARPKPAYR